jgi:dipeptidyl-peptidase 4
MRPCLLNIRYEPVSCTRRPWPGLMLAAFVFSGLVSAISMTAAAQTAQPSPSPAVSVPRGRPLTIDRVFSEPALAGQGARGLRFAPDGKTITFIRPKAEDYLQLDLWARDVATGAERVLVDSRALTGGQEEQLSETEKARRERQRIVEKGVVDYDWSAKGDLILAPIAGDLYAADPATGKARRLTTSPADEIDAKIAPRSGFVAFVRDQNLWRLDPQTGIEEQLTSDGGGNISNGLAEFVAQEELDRFTGYWIAPDDRRIVYARVDESAVALISRADIGPDGAKIVTQRYPRPGEANAAVTLFVLDLAGKSRFAVDLGFGLPPQAEYYLARVHWAPDASFFLVERLTRDQKRLDLLKVDAATGQTTLILTEQDNAWVNLGNDLRFLRGEKAFVRGAETDGFRHLYVHDYSGKLLRRLTGGNYVVQSLAGMDEARGLVFFTANRDDPRETRLYSASLKPRGKIAAPVPITREAGSWGIALAPDAKSFIGTFSSTEQPPQIGLFRMDGSRIGWVAENALTPAHPWSDFVNRYPPAEFGTLKAADGTTDLHYELRKPVGFDPARKYPAIVLVYGGPHVQTVRNAWSRPAERLFLEAGYVTFRVDNRGAYNRGKAFEAALARAMAGVEVKDQYAGLDWLKGQNFIDPARIGVTGWSYGGYMSLMLMMQEPGRFAAGLAGAPVTDWSLYDSAYTERYMSDPRDNKAGYGAANVLTYAGRLDRPLMIVHGLADDNVVFDHTTKLITALQRQARPFEIMVYPGEKHRLGPKAVNMHYWGTMLDFFNRHLKQ